MFEKNQVFVFIYFVVLFGIGLEARMMPTKEDCNDLWNVLGKQGNAIGSLRKVQTKGVDANTIVRLYEDCLRAEEGIRYRRSGGLPGFWLDQATIQAIDLQQPQTTVTVRPETISNPVSGRIEDERQVLAKLRAILSRM